MIFHAHAHAVQQIPIDSKDKGIIIHRCSHANTFVFGFRAKHVYMYVFHIQSRKGLTKIW